MRTFKEFVAEKMATQPAQTRRPAFRMPKTDDFWRRALNKAISPGKTAGIKVFR